MRTIYKTVDMEHKTATPIILRKGETGARLQFSPAVSLENYKLTGSEAFSEPTTAPLVSNILPNSNFDDGYTGFYSQQVTQSVLNNIYTIAASAVDATHYSYANLTPVAGHYFHVKINVSGLVGQARLSFVNRTSSGAYESGFASITSDGNYCFTLQTTSLYATPYFQARFQLLTSAGASSFVGSGEQIGVSLAMIIDKTADFGAGSEPTESAMTTWLARFNNSWFDSTTPKSWTAYPYTFKVTLAGLSADSASTCTNFTYLDNAHIDGDNGNYEQDGTDFYFNSDMELIPFKAWLAALDAAGTPVTITMPDIRLYVGKIYASAIAIDEESCYIDIPAEITENIGEYSSNIVITNGTYTMISPAMKIRVEEVA